MWGLDYYVFTVLPFGLSTAWYIFMKLMRPPLVKLWQGRGIRCVVYIDDGLVMSAGLAQGLHRIVVLLRNPSNVLALLLM